MTDPGADDVLAAHRGDVAALQRLVTAHLPWIEAQVRARLSAAARRDGETVDFVQEALVEVLRDGPRFLIDSTAGFRALLLRIVENNLRDRARARQRQCRDVRRERELPCDSVLMLDAPARSVTGPPAQAERQERAAWLRLALELLEPEDREVIRLREWEGQTFGEIGAAVGLGEEAVRKRYARALPRLAQKLELLRRGQWRQTLGDGPVAD
ncbi:MAG: sigma-70 family RNA polymerase sigma factor [Planctomycetes bacterium]|nr:sigma-70 family RNA polymerase sigma factor [Planctomycetota bacterium]